MILRTGILLTIIHGLIGIAIAFLWVQTGLPTGSAADSWSEQIQLFPSLYAFWIPAMYLFFTGIWLYSKRKLPLEKERFFWGCDLFTYFAVALFLLIEINWKEFKDPAIWIRGALFCLLLLKMLILLRALYTCPQLIQPQLLLVISTGVYVLCFPITLPQLSASLFDLAQGNELSRYALVIPKAVCLSFLTLEMFRLSNDMTKSVQSAFLTWAIVSFTFPAIGLPKMTFIFIGWLFIFILRMIFTRVDTRELMVGLVKPERISIAVKLGIVLIILGSAGMVFLGNVKPGFGVHSGQALESAAQTLFDGQLGLLMYAPIYWLAVFGIVYLLFFQVWNGVLLIVIGSALYGAYHLLMYGILGRVAGENGIVPFLPLFGVFIAIAHRRFRTLLLFRYTVRFFLILSIMMTVFLSIFYPEFPLIVSKMGELQHTLHASLGRYFDVIAPSMAFRPFSQNLWIWLAVIITTALVCCNHRTQSYQAIKNLTNSLERYFFSQELTFYPVLLSLFLLVAFSILHYTQSPHMFPLDEPLHLSKLYIQKELIISEPTLAALRCKEISIVSNMVGSSSLGQNVPIANVVILERDQHFESFTMKMGRDTADQALERYALDNAAAHNRAAIFDSDIVRSAEGSHDTQHTYYTRFQFSQPRNIYKIIFKFLPPQDHAELRDLMLYIHSIALSAE